MFWNLYEHLSGGSWDILQIDRRTLSLSLSLSLFIAFSHIYSHTDTMTKPIITLLATGFNIINALSIHPWSLSNMLELHHICSFCLLSQWDCNLQRQPSLFSSPPTPQGHWVAARDRVTTSSTIHILPSIAVCYQCQQVGTESPHGVGVCAGKSHPTFLKPLPANCMETDFLGDGSKNIYKQNIG